MINNYENRKGNIYFDADGSLIDSCPESHRLVCMSWPDIMKGDDYPLSLEDFRHSVRPYITTPNDFYSFTLALKNNEDFRTPEAADAVRERYGAFASTGKEAYRNARKELSGNISEWMKLMPPFSGVKEAFGKLYRLPVGIYIVSSKDFASLNSLVNYNGLKVNAIFDDQVGKRREQQLRHLELAGYNPETAILYDDNLENLLASEKARVKAFWAPQGYDIPDRIPDRFPGVGPVEFVDKVIKHLDLAA